MIRDRSGQQLDTYRLLRLLGSGTFGEVYLGEDLRRKAHVAIKVMEPFTTAEEMQQFLNEVRALIRLRHPHIVPVIDFGIDQRTPFLVMEYAPNGSLRQRHPKGVQVPLPTVVQYIKQLADALQHAHDDRLIHRDVKPDNVLLGAKDELLLSDFGIATLSSTGLIDLNRPVQENVGGTPYYMAPEMFSGKPEKASDQYSLAIMVYEWLCGTRPFTEGNFIQLGYQHTHDPVPPLREKFPTISPQVEAVIMKALAKVHTDRYPTVQAFAEALDAASKTPPIGTKLLTYRGHGDALYAFALSPDGKLFASGSASGLIQLWDAATYTLIRTCEDHSTAYVNSIAWSPDGTRLASGSDDETVQLWEASSGRVLHTYSGHTSAVSWSPDGKLLASGSADKTVKVWEASSGQLLHSYRGHASAVTSVSWSPDGTRLASGSHDKTVQVWEASSGRVLHIYRGHASAVTSVSWSPDGRQLASGSHDTTVQVWEASSGQLLHTYTGHTGGVNVVSWSPDGTRLASGSNDKTVQVWEASSGQLLHSYRGHANRVEAVSWSPDGTRLASGSSDGTVRVWEASSGRELHTYSGHRSVVHAVSWSPDGTRLASGSNDRTVQVWQAV